MPIKFTPPYLITKLDAVQDQPILKSAFVGEEEVVIFYTTIQTQSTCSTRSVSDFDKAKLDVRP